MTRKSPLRDPAGNACIHAAGVTDTGGAGRPARAPRPSDMRVLKMWQPNVLASYRADFFNTFVRGKRIYRVCQRSLVVRACCAEEACEIAKALFAELENMPDGYVHTAEIEVTAIADSPPTDGQDAVPRNPAGPAVVKARRGSRADAVSRTQPDRRE